MFFRKKKRKERTARQKAIRGAAALAVLGAMALVAFIPMKHRNGKNVQETEGTEAVMDAQLDSLLKGQYGEYIIQEMYRARTDRYKQESPKEEELDSINERITEIQVNLLTGQDKDTTELPELRRKRKSLEQELESYNADSLNMVTIHSREIVFRTQDGKRYRTFQSMNEGERQSKLNFTIQIN